MRLPRFTIRSLILLVLFVAMLLGLVVQQVEIFRLHRTVEVSLHREEMMRRQAELTALQAEKERLLAIQQLADAKAAAQANGGK
jgi:hypothetical protein